MARGLVADLARAYPDPRAAMARQMREGLSEARALFYLMAACGIFFVASVPAAIRTAQGIDADEPVSAAIGAHLFGFLFLAPVLLYVGALVVHSAARLTGGRGSALATRTATFWSLLMLAPVALAIALVSATAEIAVGPAVLPWTSLLSYAGLALWLWVFAACLAEAEGFGHSGRVALVVAAAFGAVALAVALITGGAPAGGLPEW
jgi:hypothetical protein